MDPIFTANASELPPLRACDHPGCAAGGDHRAPRSRLELTSYHWFCLEHVRAYNSAWNYYAGMSDAEVEAEIRRDTVWQRPSWRLGERHGPSPRINDPLGLHRGNGGDRGGGRRHSDGHAGAGGNGAAARAASARAQALAVFDLEPPLTAGQLKTRYITLVKLHHPDAHGGDKAAEEKLKIINQAYATLKASYFS